MDTKHRAEERAQPILHGTSIAAVMNVGDVLFRLEWRETEGAVLKLFPVTIVKLYIKS